MTADKIIQRHLIMTRQKDAFLDKNVVQTDPITGIIQWSMWSQVPGVSGSLGHGVHYHDAARATENNLVAFIRGFAWSRPNIIRGYYLQPDALTSAEVIAEMKQKIEQLVKAREKHFRPETWITDRIYADGNC